MIFSTKNRAATSRKSISVLAALIVFTISQPLVLAEKKDDVLSQKEIADIKAASLVLLRDIKPARKPGAPMETMEMDGAVIHWGYLFGGNETTGLVNLAPSKPPDDWGDENPPKYLSFFAWEKGQWVFRQCLGNAYDLFIDHHRGSPAYFLQAGHRIPDWHGEFLSWYYDPVSKKLIPTGFKQWGPFYISGGYLCTTRGYEHTGHYDTTWIYSYKNGNQGPLLGCISLHDAEDFTITFRNPKSGRMESWAFCPDKNDPLHISVHAVPKPTDTYYPYNAADGPQSAELVIASNDDIVPEDYFFEFLTGLDPDLIDTHNEQWRDDLPKRPPLKRLRIKASGNPEIVALFQPPPPAKPNPPRK